MNQNEKFLSFMESLKNEENTALVESVVSAFNIIMESEDALVEGKLSKAAGILGMVLPMLGLSGLTTPANAGTQEQANIVLDLMKESGLSKHELLDIGQKTVKGIYRIEPDKDKAEQIANDFTNAMMNELPEESVPLVDNGGTETGLESSRLELTPEKAIASLVKSSHGNITEDDIEVTNFKDILVKKGFLSDTEQDYYVAHRKNLTPKAKQNLMKQVLKFAASAIGTLPES